jgi:GTP cyclohydrolase II
MKFLAKLSAMFQSAPTIRQKITIPIRNGVGTFVTFRGLPSQDEHIAIGFGNWETQKSPLVRIHSECLTGDVFHSGKCDCGEQLNEAMDLMQAEGGILIYLRQEGRGIGLYNKLDAYVLQAQGMDTYEANRTLGFADDLRDYKVAAQMLKAMGKTCIELLSNNPLKLQQIANYGIELRSHRATGVFVKPTNKDYLNAKVQKTHHMIALPAVMS